MLNLVYQLELSENLYSIIEEIQKFNEDQQLRNQNEIGEMSSKEAKGQKKKKKEIKGLTNLKIK